MDTSAQAGGKPLEGVRQVVMEGRLKAMIGMWQVFTSISSLLSGSTLEGIPREVDNTLKVLASYGREDRCALFLVSEDRLYLHQAHAYASPGVAGYPGHFHRLRMDAFPWLGKRLESLKPVCVPRVEDLPLEAAEWKDFLGAQGVRSLLLIPMACGSQLMGVVSMESTRGCRTWDNGLVSLYRAASEILASACLRKRAEEELGACRGKLRSLSADLLLAEEKERRRIASDLHDRIGHALAAASMKLKMLEKKASPDLSTEVHEVTGLVDELIRESQSLTFSISPPVLYDFGLEAAVEWLAEETNRRHGLDVGLTCLFEEGQIDSSTRVLAYHATRELLFNTVKHAQARKVNVSITCRKMRLYVVIEDDGRGFLLPDIPPGAGSRGGFGLFNIREKLVSRGGTLLVESRLDRGTRITLIFPLTDKGPA
jgi:signal transduction histidine kinase